MLLALGPHDFDITYRAIVMGVVDLALEGRSDAFVRDADRLVVEGADALAIDRIGSGGDAHVTEADEIDQLGPAVAALRSRFDVPVGIRTTRASVAHACFAEGAMVGHDDSGFSDPDYLAVAVSAGATVVVGSGGHSGAASDVGSVAGFLGARARTAAAAGLPADRIVLHLDLDRAVSRAAELVRDVDGIARLGWPVALTAPTGRVSGPDPAHAVGITRGARVVRTRDVRAARRVAEVAARLLEARAESGILREVS